MAAVFMLAPGVAAGLQPPEKEEKQCNAAKGGAGILTVLFRVLHCVSGKPPLDDKIKQLLRELGTAINESISGSDDVNRHIQKIRDEGYDLYVVLDATIGLNRQDGEEPQPQLQFQPHSVSNEMTPAVVARNDGRDGQFRINVNDLALLRALGIDPTRKVRTARRLEPLGQSSDHES
jgi:hypothetical protein